MSEFPNTHWTTVVYRAAEGGSEAAAAAALNELCSMYWYPIYAYARSWGKTQHEAEDLTQTFFSELIRNNWVSRAERGATTFRTFLLTHFKYVLSNEHRRQIAQKRGGAFEHVSFDFEEAQERYLSAGEADPTQAYDRAWAEQVIEQVLRLLQKEYSGAHMVPHFDRLRGFLPGGAALPQSSYSELCAEYGLKPDALRQRVSRLNRRFREILVSTIAETVSEPAQVQEEIQSLLKAMSAR